MDWEAPDPASFDALLVTSANAVRSAGETLRNLRALPVHAVGEATAAAAREAGFGIASTGDADIERLLSSIEPDLRLLHLCGEHRRSVAEVRQTITPVVVYRSEALARPSELDGIAGQVAAVHSPRAAERLAELVEPETRKSVRLAAISEAAARAAGSGWEMVEAADKPTDEALLEVAGRLCED